MTKIKCVTKESVINLMKRVNLVEVITKEVIGTIVSQDFLIGDLKCPFHSDLKSSMVLKDNKYYCFECEASGNALDFLMCYKKLGFFESVEYLAEMYDVKLEYKKKKDE
jgi:DNA primase